MQLNRLETGSQGLIRTGFGFANGMRLSVELHLRHKRTDEQRRVYLSVVPVRGIHPMGEGDEPRFFTEI